MHVMIELEHMPADAVPLYWFPPSYNAHHVKESQLAHSQQSTIPGHVQPSYFIDTWHIQESHYHRTRLKKGEIQCMICFYYFTPKKRFSAKSSILNSLIVSFLKAKLASPNMHWIIKQKLINYRREAAHQGPNSLEHSAKTTWDNSTCLSSLKMGREGINQIIGSWKKQQQAQIFETKK